MTTAAFSKWINRTKAGPKMPEADQVVPIIRNAGTRGISWQRLTGLLDLEPKLLHRLLSALVDAGQIVAVWQDGCLMFRSASRPVVAEAQDASNRLKAIATIIDALREALAHFDLATRHLAWERLRSEQGERLIAKLLRNPHVALSKGEVRKLVEG
jgi:hypothetical protein